MGLFDLAKRTRLTPDVTSSNRYDWQDLRQEAAIRLVHSQGELIAAVSEAANNNIREIVIASDIVISQSITLNVAGLRLSCAGSAQVSVGSGFSGPMFIVAESNIQIINFRMAHDPLDPLFYSTLNTFCDIDSSDLTPARVVGFELSGSRITVAADGYIIDQGNPAINSVARSCTISNNLWNHGPCSLRLNMSESQISGNTSLYEWSIFADDTNCFQNSICFNAMNEGNINTDRGLGNDHTAVVGNTRVNTITLGTNSVSVGNT